MTRLESTLRVLIAFMAASYLTSMFYKDFFFASRHNPIIFLFWGLPCLYFMIVCLHLFGDFLGKGYS